MLELYCHNGGNVIDVPSRRERKSAGGAHFSKVMIGQFDRIRRQHIFKYDINDLACNELIRISCFFQFENSELYREI
ncbi:unnamed protein product [Calypogeia fissa]